MILISSVTISILIILYSIFAGRLTVYFSNGQLHYREFESMAISYYTIKSKIPLQIVGIGKHERILVSDEANEYFENDSMFSLLLHEKGHSLSRYPLRKMIYLLVRFNIIYLIGSVYIGWWQSLVLFACYKGINLFIDIIYDEDQKKNELLADRYAGTVMKKAGKLHQFTKAMMELPYLRRSASHPSINERIKFVYEAVKDIK